MVDSGVKEVEREERLSFWIRGGEDVDEYV